MIIYDQEGKFVIFTICAANCILLGLRKKTRVWRCTKGHVWNGMLVDTIPVIAITKVQKCLYSRLCVRRACFARVYAGLGMANRIDSGW